MEEVEAKDRAKLLSIGKIFFKILEESRLEELDQEAKETLKLTGNSNNSIYKILEESRLEELDLEAKETLKLTGHSNNSSYRIFSNSHNYILFQDSH